MSETYLSSLNTALHQTMATTPEAVVIGEDILDPYGGAFKVTKGLSDAYPERVFATPISESAIVGIATGLAVRGFKPVAEIMFGDFMALTADQLLNSASKFALMYKDAVSVPLVVRTPMGGGRGYGPTHSQCLEKMFLGIPGLKVVSPSLFHQPGELLAQTIKHEQQPAIFVEYKNLYGLQLPAPGPLSIKLTEKPYPVAIVENSTSQPDVVIISYGGLSEQIMLAMEGLIDEEINVRAIFPSLLSSPLSDTHIEQYLSDSHCILITDNNTPGFSWVSETAAQLHESGRLNGARIHRLTAADTVVPAAKTLEDEVLVTEKRLLEHVFEIIS